jgi:thymidylate kinase
MIVEFVGCTGAGKTTLINEVQCRLAEADRVTTSYDLVAAPLGLTGVSSRMVRNFIQEFAVMPTFMRTLFKNKAVIAFTLRMLKRQANLPLYTINNLRCVERSLGVYEKIKRHTHDRIILVDEGTVHLAHKVFVFNDAFYASEEILKFANLIPVPDLVVYLRAPIETLIQRTVQRSDPPREIRENRLRTEVYIHRAVAMFERVIQAENISSRLLVVDNPDFTDEELQRAADDVAWSILNTKSSNKLTHPASLRKLWKNCLKLENSLKN